VYRTEIARAADIENLNRIVSAYSGLADGKEFFAIRAGSRRSVGVAPGATTGYERYQNKKAANMKMKLTFHNNTEYAFETEPVKRQSAEAP